MPLKWKRDENPYRVNYFTILGIGPNARRREISATRKKLIKKLKNKKHTIGNRDIKETEIQEAETRLLDEQSWAEEALLVHPAPEHQSKRLQRILRDILQNISKATQTSAIERQTISHSSPQKLKLANLKSLTSLIPEPCPEDVSLPKWEEFAVSDVDSPEDRQYDIQFDL